MKKIVRSILVFCFVLIVTVKDAGSSESCSRLVGKTIAVRGVVKNSLILVGKTPDDLEELLHAVIAGDNRWMGQIVFSARGFSISPGTEVAILTCDNYRGMVKIRILSSDTEHLWYVGWTYTDMVLGTDE